MKTWNKVLEFIGVVSVMAGIVTFFVACNMCGLGFWASLALLFVLALCWSVLSQHKAEEAAAKNNASNLVKEPVNSNALPTLTKEEEGILKQGEEIAIKMRAILAKRGMS